jgi:hypothetical protein
MRKGKIREEEEGDEREVNMKKLEDRDRDEGNKIMKKKKKKGQERLIRRRRARRRETTRRRGMDVITESAEAQLAS